MNLIFLGAPGVGKGTQAKLVITKYDIPQISTGDILRAAVGAGTTLGVEAKSYMDKGELVPDEVIINMINERFKEADTKNGFILDGFPRSLPQAEALAKLLTQLDMPLKAVINIAVPEEDIVKRLTSRRVCRKCGDLFNMIFNPPQDEQKCSEGGECDIYQRDDDKEATIRNRLEVYNNQTAPLINFYTKQGLVEDIDGRQNPEDVNKSIIRFLDGLS